MVTLSLLRHAKSAWNVPGLADFERSLAPRGRKAAPRMGRFMAENAIRPDLVLCSGAARARQTLAHVLTGFSAWPEVQYSNRLYGASPQDMLGMVHDLPDTSRHAMLVGHNPAMQAFAIALCGEGDPKALEALRAKFPTAALAVIDFDCIWAQIALNGGRLRLFVVPRQLPER